MRGGLCLRYAESGAVKIKYTRTTNSASQAASEGKRGSIMCASPHAQAFEANRATGAAGAWAATRRAEERGQKGGRQILARRDFGRAPAMLGAGV